MWWWLDGEWSMVPLGLRRRILIGQAHPHHPRTTLAPPAYHPRTRHTGKSKSLLTQFGNLIAVDMLVNNFDRSPAIWTHEGNANNILIELVGDEVVVR